MDETPEPAPASEPEPDPGLKPWVRGVALAACVSWAAYLALAAFWIPSAYDLFDKLLVDLPLITRLALAVGNLFWNGDVAMLSCGVILGLAWVADRKRSMLLAVLLLITTQVILAGSFTSIELSKEKVRQALKRK